MQPRFSWNLVPRERRPATRLRRTARVAFRICRDIAAILGICFAYLLILGYFQYLDAQAKSDIVCAISRCT